MNLHSVLPRSRANGPGVRTVLWVQGCSLRCPGCFNPDTHSRAPHLIRSVEGLLALLRAEVPHVEGLTVSGGEPLDQAVELTELLRRVRAETSLSVLLFTGYTWEEVQSDATRREVLSYVDVLLAGRYDATRHLAAGLRGSANKTVHLLTARYSAADLEEAAPAEVVIGPDGQITVSGIDPPQVV